MLVLVLVSVTAIVEAGILVDIEAEVSRMTGEVVATAALAVTRHSTPASAHVEKLWPPVVGPTVCTV